MSKFHFVSTFNDLFDPESSWSNNAPYSGWNDLLNNLGTYEWEALYSLIEWVVTLAFDHVLNSE